MTCVGVMCVSQCVRVGGVRAERLCMCVCVCVCISH